MSFWESRTAAWLLTVCMILFAVYTGAGASLGKLRAQAEEVFTRGEYGDGKGIAYDLAQITEECDNLLTVAARYVNETDSLAAELRACQKALKSAQGPAQMHEANLRLARAEQALYDFLGTLSLSERDKNYRNSIHVNINSHNRIIALSPYNAQAQAFNKTLTKQPARILGAFTDVKELELYR